jgi:hypothetical protein
MVAHVCQAESCWTARQRWLAFRVESRFTPSLKLWRIRQRLAAEGRRPDTRDLRRSPFTGIQDGTPAGPVRRPFECNRSRNGTVTR